MSLSNPLSQSKAPGVLSLGIAVLSVAVALVTARLLDIYLVTAPASLFLCAVMFSTWAGGARAGLFSVALSLLCFHYYFLAPIHSLAIRPDQIPRTIIFALTALFVWSLSARQSSATDSLMVARDNLTKAVEELGRINEALQAENAERKRAEDVVGKQAQLLDLTHDSIFVRDLNDVITYWNRGAEELYGWKSDQAIGKVSHQLMRTVFPAPLQEINAELLRTGRWEGELVHARRDGHPLAVASRWSLQRDDHGRPMAILETNNDISDRKRAEDALHKTQMELAHVTRVTTLGELTASIVHEVNQPLAAIVTNGEVCIRWLDRAVPDLAEVREVVGAIIGDGRRASEIIHRLRALSTKSETHKVAVHINDAISEVIPLVQREVLRHRVSLRLELAPTLPAVLGDRVQLQQVLINLIVNGMEATEAVTDWPRELVVRSQLDDSGHVLVGVEDSGVGIDPENFNQLFNAFFTTKASGLGMGLSICRSIIENHGGTLWASRNAGPGATFQFALRSRQDARS
jgi:PAS domain S-box-containing protein